MGGSDAGPGEPRTIETVGVFDNVSDMEQAASDLLAGGFEHADLSLLASPRTVARHLGHDYTGVVELEDDPAAPRARYLSRASLKWVERSLVAALAVAGGTGLGMLGLQAFGGTPGAAALGIVGLGAGGVAGAFIAKALGDRKARDLVGQLARGGLVLWVRTADAARQARAYDVLSRHSAHHVRVHTVPRHG